MKILLGADGSPHSQAAVNEVARRPWPPKTQVRVLSSVQLVPPTAADMVLTSANTLDQLLEQQTTEAHRVVEEAAAALKAKGLDADGVVRTGDPRATIVDESREWGADLIVLGSHGRTGLKRWLLGSVAQSIVAHAPCSVEVVRQPGAFSGPS